MSRSGSARARVAPPAVEVRARDDVGRDPLVVEGEQRLVAHAQVAPARALLERVDLLEQRLVGRQERVPASPTRPPRARGG